MQSKHRFRSPVLVPLVENRFPQFEHSTMRDTRDSFTGLARLKTDEEARHHKTRHHREIMEISARICNQKILGEQLSFTEFRDHFGPSASSNDGVLKRQGRPNRHSLGRYRRVKTCFPENFVERNSHGLNTDRGEEFHLMKSCHQKQRDHHPGAGCCHPCFIYSLCGKKATSISGSCLIPKSLGTGDTRYQSTQKTAALPKRAAVEDSSYCPTSRDAYQLELSGRDNVLAVSSSTGRQNLSIHSRVNILAEKLRTTVTESRHHATRMQRTGTGETALRR